MFRRKRKRYEYLAFRQREGSTIYNDYKDESQVYEYQPFAFNNLGSQGWRYVESWDSPSGSTWFLFERESVW